MASLSVQPFLQGSLVWQTDRQTDQPIDRPVAVLQQYVGPMYCCSTADCASLWIGICVARRPMYFVYFFKKFIVPNSPAYLDHVTYVLWRLLFCIRIRFWHWLSLRVSDDVVSGLRTSFRPTACEVFYMQFLTITSNVDAIGWRHRWAAPPDSLTW